MYEPRVIEFFFDIGSPYSYLAATQVRGLAERTGAALRWRPFLLGGVFKATGNEMPAHVPAKAKYMLDDLERWARRYDEPFRFPSRFPLNTLKTQRALVAAARQEASRLPDFALGLFRAYWAEDRDVSAEDQIHAVAEDCGLDGSAVIAASNTQTVKDELRAVTDEAVERGAFGAPTLFVGDAMYWGNDRLGLLETDLTP